MYWDDEIHRALAHPIRRRILECLRENDLSFRELLKRVSVANHGKLGFHIRALRGLVEREPSLKKYRLTDRGRLASELVWDIRFVLERGRRDLTSEPTRAQVLNYVKKLSVGTHAIFLYESLRIKHQVLFTFLREGLEKREMAIYVAAEETPEQIRRAMKDFGIDVKKYEVEGSMRIPNYDPWYMRRGVVNPLSEIMEKWNEAIQHFEVSGKEGMRVTSDVSLQFIKHDKSRELLEYETSLGRTLKVPVTLICAYNTRQTMRGRPQFFVDTLKTHGHALFQGIAFELIYK